MTSFEVDAEGFFTWINDVSSKFPRMVRTMKNVAELIQLETIPLVPLETSALEQSFFYVTVNRSPFILLGVGFDAVDERSGFHYAKYQHDDIYTHQHPLRGEQFYLTKGIEYSQDEFFELIEKDYLSLLSGGNVSWGRTNIDERVTPREVFFDLDNLRGDYW